jgi:hypothetical protein
MTHRHRGRSEPKAARDRLVSYLNKADKPGITVE